MDKDSGAISRASKIVDKMLERPLTLHTLDASILKLPGFPKNYWVNNSHVSHDSLSDLLTKVTLSFLNLGHKLND